MNLENMRLKILSFNTAVRVDRRAFKKAIVSICKAVPNNQEIRLIVKKGSTDMILLASQKISYPTEECGVFAPTRTRRPREENYWELAADPSENKAKKPAFWIYAIIHDIENAEPMDLLVNGKVIRSWLKEIICNGKEKVHIKRNENGLNFCFGDGPDAVRKNIDFIDKNNDDREMKQKEDDLEYLSRVKYVDDVQIEDFSYYFKETMHANDPYPYFSLSVDEEKHCIVTSAIESFRGYITGGIKHTFYFFRPEAKRLAALFLDKTVTIHIPKYNDFLQLTDGFFTVFIPIPYMWCPNNQIEKRISYVERDARKKVLTITVPREKLMEECKSMPSPNIQLTVQGQTLKIMEYEGTPEPHVEFSIEKTPRDKNISCAVHAECLCDALRSITSPSISIRFTPQALFITDHYMSTRRLPHSLRALEIVYLLKDSVHIL